MKMSEVNSVYFIGIGGIGMSALARFFHAEGKKISGYDRTETSITRDLAAMGMEITYVDSVDTIPSDIDLAIYTPAIPKDHKGLNYFRNKGIPLLKRSQVLGLISENMRTIAVAGTHGKTSTSSLVAHFLRDSGVDCTAFLGGLSNNLGGNFIHGTSDWVVIEADEFDRSFLTLSPEIAVITCIDPDHLDIYGDEKTFIDGFIDFINKIKPNGHLVIHEDAFQILEDMGAFNDLIKKDFTVHVYGEIKANILIKNIHNLADGMGFDYANGLESSSFELTYYGRHNVLNAVAAITVAKILGISDEKLIPAAKKFKGIWRRFDVLIRNEHQVYIDDYAHHPTEINALINSVKSMFPGQKVRGIFQPHLYSRTRDFLQEFAESLQSLDEIMLLEIYPARELPIEGITSQAILDLIINENKSLKTKSEVIDWVKIVGDGVILTIGAGDIDSLRNPIVEQLNARLS